MISIWAKLTYNIFFDIAAILNLIIVLFAFGIHKRLPEQKNKVFLLLCISTLCSSIVDCVSGLSLSQVIHVSNYGLWGLNVLYFVFCCSIPFFFLLYNFALTDEFKLIQKWNWAALIFIPVLVEIICICITPAFHFVFNITADGSYERGPGVYILYAIMVYQVLVGLVVIFLFRRKITSQGRLYIVSFIVLTMVGVIIQFINPYLLVQHFAISVSLLLIYTSLQNIEVITDGVTGLLNLKSFNLIMNLNFKRRNCFTIISIHLDDLQFMITTFGMEGINILQRQIADFLQTINPTYQCFQLEPDLFCVVLPDVKPPEYSAVTASIMKRFNQTWKNAIIEMKVSASQCVIRCPADAENTETIIDTINSAKHDNRYKGEKLLFAHDIDVSTRKRFTYIEQLVKTAIQERRIEVMYQPLYSTSEKRIIGAEALVRMKDKEGNYISPDEFVPIAEQDGFILRIGLYVYEEVCRFLSSTKLHKLGVQMIDVNLSVAQCMQTRICEEFLEILEFYNLPPSLINLEITETAAAHTPELLYSNMDKFKKLGFSCSLDDYGTGYANLSYMLHMPFSMIKIDKEIVWSAMSDVKAYVMLVGIIDMIHKLNMRTVAEGIETKEMVDKLTELKCDYLQGFYYSRPVPENEFYELLKKQAEEMGVIENNVDSIFTKDLYPEESDDIEELEVLDE